MCIYICIDITYHIFDITYVLYACVYMNRYINTSIYIYIYIYMRLAPCGAPDFGIFYVEKGVLTCTRVHVLTSRCSHAGENTIS